MSRESATPVPDDSRNLTARIRPVFDPKRLAVALVAMLLLGAEGGSCSFSGSGSGTVTCEGDGCFQPAPPGGGSGEGPVEPSSNEGDSGTTVEVSPEEVTLSVGGRVTFTADVELGAELTDESVIWSTTGGHITTEGVYTAPPLAGRYLVRATSNDDKTAWAEALVVVKQVAVTIFPERAHVLTGTTLQFQAAVNGTFDTGVVWSIKEGAGAENGTINASGLYRAPEDSSANGRVVTIRATSTADPTARASATVKVSTDIQGAIRVESCLKETVLLPNEPLRLAADVINGTQSMGVSWSIEPLQGHDPGDPMLLDNLVVGGSQPGRFRVRATSNEDQSKFTDVLVSVVEPVVPGVRGYLSASAGASIPENAQVIVGGGFGLSSRQGAGLFNIRGSRREHWPDVGIAFVDAGEGTPMPGGLFGFLEAHGDGRFHDLRLSPAPATHALPEGAVEWTASGPTWILVEPRMVRSNWPLPPFPDEEEEDAFLEGIDAHEVEIYESGDQQGTSVTRSLPPGLGSGDRLVLFSGLSSGTYKIRTRPRRGSDFGDWSEEAEIQLSSAPGGQKVSGTLRIIDDLPLGSAQAIIRLDPVGGTSGPGGLAVLSNLSADTDLAWSIANVPVGFYRATVLLDLNGDGVGTRGEPVQSIRHLAVIDDEVEDIVLEIGASPRTVVQTIASSDELTLQVEVWPGAERLMRATLASGPTSEVPVNDTFASPVDMSLREPMENLFVRRLVTDPFGEATGDVDQFLLNHTLWEPAGNVVRTCSESVPFHVIGAEEPSRIWSVTIDDTADPLQPAISWDYGERPGAIGFLLQILQASDGEEISRKTLGPSAMMHEVQTALDAETEYRIRITSVGITGSMAIAEASYTTPPAPPPGGE